MDQNNAGTIEEHTEEYYGLELEHEFEEDLQGNEHPFDADEIRIDQQMLSLKYITELMKDKQIILNPGFQRYKVWTERKRKSLLIESLMLRIPIPAFYFYENEDSRFIVIDGQQRLSTIEEFIQNKFKLYGLEYLEKPCGGKSFSELDTKYQQRIYRTQLAVNVLDARSPTNVVFDIFRRVNTGGISLKPQEIRNAIAKQTTREFLKDLYETPEFKKATRNRIKDDRMDGQEMILRFFAFYRAYNYESRSINYSTGNIATFLDKALIELNQIKGEELKKYKKIFLKAMNRSYKLFKKFTFRKCYLDEHGNIFSNIDVINKALFTSWSVILANPNFDNLNFDTIGGPILQGLAKELTHNYIYNNCLTQGTNSTRSVQISFAIANDILKEVLGDDF